MHSSRGVTLVELLITVLLASIVFLALSIPFVTERRMWVKGIAQAESQRDAQVAFRAIARAARSGGGFTITGAAGSNVLTIQDTPGGNTIACFQGGPGFANQFQTEALAACSPASFALIDGDSTRSAVTDFTATEIIPNKLFHIQINVLHRSQENEFMETRIYLRNA